MNHYMSYPYKAVLAAPRWSLHGALLLCESFSLTSPLGGGGEDLQGCTLAPNFFSCMTGKSYFLSYKSYMYAGHPRFYEFPFIVLRAQP